MTRSSTRTAARHRASRKALQVRRLHRGELRSLAAARRESLNALLRRPSQSPRWISQLTGSVNLNLTAPPQQELRGLRALWAVRVLGFAGAGGVVLLGGDRQELACDGRVLDGGGVAGPEQGGELQGGSAPQVRASLSCRSTRSRSRVAVRRGRGCNSWASRPRHDQGLLDRDRVHPAQRCPWPCPGLLTGTCCDAGKSARRRI